jgi:hypothetical protein
MPSVSLFGAKEPLESGDFYTLPLPQEDRLTGFAERGKMESVKNQKWDQIKLRGN